MKLSFLKKLQRTITPKRSQRKQGQCLSSKSQSAWKRKPRKNRSLKKLKHLVTRADFAGQQQLGGKTRSETLYKNHLFSTFQALKFVKKMSPVCSELLEGKLKHLERRPGYEDKKLAVFDLDETLVHCCDSPNRCDFEVTVNFGGCSTRAGINLRPFAIECLKEANKMFEVIVFTASHQCYADKVIDYLDPKKELIHHRLYRDSCFFTDGVYVKDLRIFAGRDPKDIVIIDNAAYSFAFQIDNGIPIISWRDDYRDRELFNLIGYLKVLSTAPDIRDVNRNTFRLASFYDDYIEQMHNGSIVHSKSPDILEKLVHNN